MNDPSRPASPDAALKTELVARVFTNCRREARLIAPVALAMLRDDPDPETRMASCLLSFVCSLIENGKLAHVRRDNQAPVDAAPHTGGS